MTDDMSVFVCVWLCFALEMGLCFVLRFLLEPFLTYFHVVIVKCVIYSFSININNTNKSKLIIWILNLISSRKSHIDTSDWYFQHPIFSIHVFFLGSHSRKIPLYTIQIHLYEKPHAALRYKKHTKHLHRC